jgi:hypothetical protein
MYQVPFPNSTMGVARSGLRVRVFNLFLVAGLILDSYIYLHIGWEISLNFSGTRPRKEKKRTPPCLFHISWNFFSLSLARVVGDFWLFMPPSIRRLFSLSASSFQSLNYSTV